MKEYHKNTKFPKINYKDASKEFAYVLGTILTDGSVDKNLTYVRLDVIDKDFALEFKKHLENWTGLYVSMLSYQEEGYKKVWYVSLSSTIVAQYLKNYNYKKVKNFNKECKKYFLRAVFDAESSVSTFPQYIDITCINYEFLSFIKALLLDFKINSREIYIMSKIGDKHGYGFYKHNLYELVIGRRVALEKYNLKIGYTIKRKQDNLDKLLKSYKGVTKNGKKLSWNTGLTIETSPLLREVGEKIKLSRRAKLNL